MVMFITLVDHACLYGQNTLEGRDMCFGDSKDRFVLDVELCQDCIHMNTYMERKAQTYINCTFVSVQSSIEMNVAECPSTINIKLSTS